LPSITPEDLDIAQDWIVSDRVLSFRANNAVRNGVAAKEKFIGAAYSRE
jgi:hypothetical protein